MKVGIITGVTGQDGSYLSELLLSKDYDVIGITRRTSTPNTSRIEHIFSNQRFKLVQADMSDFASLLSVFQNVTNYDSIEVYNLAAQSQVGSSFSQPEFTADINAIGVLRILECIRYLNIIQKTRIYQASTSELYGKVREIPQTEDTPFYPRSPYGVAKLYAYWIIKNYRESYNFYACNGILFNHESERRGLDFVTRKITTSIKKIYDDSSFTLTLGNLNACRDWGHAEDYVYAMWLMLQQETPDDYVIASGETHSVREFVELAFKYAGHTITWEGTDIEEVGKDETGRVVVRIDPKYYRPAEVDILIGNPEKATNKLGWVRKNSFNDLVRRMVQNDVSKSEFLLVNIVEKRNGSYQYFKEIASQVMTDTLFDYIETVDQQVFLEYIKYRNYKAILINYHHQTQPGWKTMYNDKIYYMYHESTFDIMVRLDRIIDNDPTLPNGIPRPLYQKRPVPVKKNDIVTIGTFGLSYNLDRYLNVMRYVNDQFDVAKIRLHTSTMSSVGNSMIQYGFDRCRELITKPGIILETSSNLMEPEELMNFLASNDINIFLYEDQPDRGCSSVFDFALSSGKPIAIWDTHMFRHVYDDIISVKKRPIIDIINDPKVMDYIESLHSKWNPETLRNKLITLLSK